MQYRTLGRTGVQVSSLVLGAMNFGSLGRTTQDDATAIIDAALEGGINLIDTADMYSNGESEEMVARPAARGRGPRAAGDGGVRPRRAGLESAGLGLAVGRGPRGRSAS